MTTHKNQAGQPSPNGGHFAAKTHEDDEIVLDSGFIPQPIEPLELPSDDWRTGGIGSEEDFEDAYDVVEAPDGSTVWELDDVISHDIDENRIWTLMDGDDDKVIATSGFYRVDTIGYVVTSKPRENINEDYVWSQPDPEVEEDRNGEGFDDEYGISEHEALDAESYDDEGLDEAE
tara:strand:+ start:11075 stop:11599 length:525 start_codon:yes stop_codon:yes gene_type:complete